MSAQPLNLPACPSDEIELIDRALADVGTIHRRAAAETLSAEEMRQLLDRVRRRLKLVRASRLAEEGSGSIELTDLGRAHASAVELASKPGLLVDLLNQLPSLRRGSDLIEGPAS